MVFGGGLWIYYVAFDLGTLCWVVVSVFVLLILLITGVLYVNSVVTISWLGCYVPYYLFVMCLVCC